MLGWPQSHLLCIRADCVACFPFSGDALGFAVRYIMSQVHGARPEASKAVVIMVTDTSTDSVDAAAAAARSNRKCPEYGPELPPTCWRTASRRWSLWDVLADLGCLIPTRGLVSNTSKLPNPWVIWTPNSNKCVFILHLHAFDCNL